jgi:hypothetical protein
LIGEAVKAIIKRIFAWAIKLCKIVIGVVVIKTGFDFAGGSGAFAYQEGDFITGVFVMIIGAYFVLSTLFPGFFDRPE